MFKLDLMVPRASGNQDIGRRDRNTGGARASRKFKGSAPDCMVDAQFRKQAFEISKHLLVTIATRAIP